jgi:tRNA(fMet)-specific endonuclease VapC
MSLLIDTNILIYAYRDQGGCRQRLEAQDPSQVCICVVNAVEIAFGAAKATRPEPLRRFWADALRRYRLAPLDLPAASQAGALRAQLEAVGRPIGAYDLLIAGIALAHDLTVVTRNTREFTRVPGLRVENWYE